MDYRRVPDNGGRVTGRGSCAISGVTTSAETRLFPLDPLWVAEQNLQRPRKGVALIRESCNQCDTLAGSQCRL